MPTARHSSSAPSSPNKKSGLLSFLPSSTADNYTYTSLINADDDTHSQPYAADGSSGYRAALPEQLSPYVHRKSLSLLCAPFCCILGRFLRWRWRWAAVCSCLAALLITAATISYVWYRSIYPAGQLCPIDLTGVDTQYKQLAQHHLLDVRGYRLLSPHSITASTVSTTHQAYEDVTRFRWDVRRPRTWWQWLWHSPAVVVMVTRDGSELSSVPATARSYVRVTLRFLQELVDGWQPSEQLPQYMDILINTDFGDQLRDQSNSASSDMPPTSAPIFSSCSTRSAADVPFVYAEAWKPGGVYKKVESQLLFAMSHIPESAVTLATGEQCVNVAAFTAQHWAAKSPTAIWRGSTTGGLYTPSTYHTFTRYQLALLSRHNRTGLIDAKLTHCSQCEPNDEMERLLRTQLGDHFQRDLVNAEQLTHYRALIDVDGNSWSSRLPQLMASGAAVLKQASPYREFWYDLLRPDTHYIEVARNVSDVEHLTEAAVERGGAVAVNALRFARQYLTEAAVRLYAQHVLSEYAALLEVPAS